MLDFRLLYRRLGLIAVFLAAVASPPNAWGAEDSGISANPGAAYYQMHVVDDI